MGEEKFIMRCDVTLQAWSPYKNGLKAYLIWIPKYRKRVLVASVAIRARDV